MMSICKNVGLQYYVSLLCHRCLKDQQWVLI